jgi:hypothetical protein
MKFLGVIFTISILHTACYGQIKTDHQKAITMLKTYYNDHTKVWEYKGAESPDVFDKKLDALQLRYCTKKLRSLSQKVIDYPGTDVLTNNMGIDITSIKTMTIVKDPVKKNIYIVSYDTFIRLSSTQLQQQHVILHVGVVKAGDDYKIASVNGAPE